MIVVLIPLMGGQPSDEARFVVPHGWPYKRGYRPTLYYTIGILVQTGSVGDTIKVNVLIKCPVIG